jgi:hypothetical protein
MVAFAYGNFNGMLVKDCVCFFQEWLFFRLLEAIFSIGGVSFRHNDFVAYADPEAFISTSALPKYLWYWLASEMDTSRSVKESRNVTKQPEARVSSA